MNFPFMPTVVVITTWKCQVTFVFVQKKKRTVILQDSALSSLYVGHSNGGGKIEWVYIMTSAQLLKSSLLNRSGLWRRKGPPEAIRWLYSSLKVFFLTRARHSWLLLTLALIFFLSQADTWSGVSVEGVDHFFVDCRVNRAIMKGKWLAKSYLWTNYFPRDEEKANVVLSLSFIPSSPG